MSKVPLVGGSINGGVGVHDALEAKRLDGLKLRKFKLPELADSQLPIFERVVVVLASSRSGSSFLFDALRTSGAFLSLPGEHTASYKLFGLLGPQLSGGDGDGEIPDGADVAGFRQSLREDVTAGPSPRPLSREFIALHLLRTLCRQWGTPPLGLDATEQLIRAALADELELTSSDEAAIERFLKVVVKLRAAGWPIDPWYYDVPASAIKRHLPTLPCPDGPPHVGALLEAPPFIVPVPEPAPRPDQLRLPLLIKASVDAYRVSSLLDIFAGCDVQFVHLTRNAAASINGLLDGWLSRGFFSHNLVDRPLAIEGYTDERGWTQSWWNFDLPPNWAALTALPLARVCAEQWAAAQRAILSAPIGSHRVHQVRAESLLNRATQNPVVLELLDKLGVSPTRTSRHRVVMATEKPSLARWRSRERELLPILAEPALQEISRLSGYGDRPTDEWT